MLSDKAAIKLQVLTNLCNGPHVKVDQAAHCRVTIKGECPKRRAELRIVRRGGRTE